MFLRNCLFLLVVLVMVFAFAGNLFAFAAGTGTSVDPFQITTWEHLNNVRNYLGSAYSDTHFKLMNNLDSTTVGYDIYASDTANGDSGWEPIGSNSGESAFQGIFDGDSYTISGFYINRPVTNHVGLFGYAQNSTIKNIGVIDFNCTGKSYVGGLVGKNWSGTITNSYASGTVSGSGYVGGLVGTNSAGIITKSYAAVNVTGSGSGLGGLSGAIELNGIITNSYASGTVSGGGFVGGLVGFNGGGTITNSYASGKTTGASDVGGLVGKNLSGTITNSFYDIYTTGQSDIGKGLGFATMNMVDSGVFIDSGWSFTDTWTILPNRSYPFLKWQSSDTPFATAYSIDSAVLPSSDSGSVTISADTQFAGGTVTITANANPGYELYSWTISPDSGIIANTASATTQYSIVDTNVTITANFIIERIFAGGDGSEGDPYQISTWKHLNNIRDYLGSGHTNTHFILNNNLDPGTDGYDDYASSIANGGEGWEPIGFDQDANAFHGTIDGDSKTISGLYINRPDSNFVGLFGYIRNSMIKNVGIIDINCTGVDNVGGLVGRNWEGIIKNSYATGSLTGNSNVGGLVGHNYMSNAIIIESYANVNVTGNTGGGGLVGSNYDGTIINCYAMGNVSGNSNVGGLVGSNSNNGEIRKSYAVGKVTAGGNLGGLVGNNSGTVEDSFFDINTTGRPFEDVGDGRHTIKMVDSGVFTDVGWDFADTWTILPNQSYPFFKWQTSDTPFAAALSIDSAVSPAGAGQITISADTQFAGGTVAITAIANTGYEFDSWTVSPFSNDYGNMNDSVTIFIIYDDTNITITANFIGDFAGGDGSEGNPFQITTWEHLNNVRKYLGDTYTNTHFKLIDNLDSNTPDYDEFASSTANDGFGWEPIGWKDGAMDNNNPFFGTFDGDSKTISGLYINRPDSNYVGLFGYIENSIIKNVGVIDINYIGNSFVGGLVGFNNSGTITKSYATGNVNGSGSGMVVGGLTGTNQGTITNSYANVNSNGNTDIGGLVGQLTAAVGTIKNSYARGNANGNARIGGLVGGRSNGIIINSYAVGKVSGNSDVGGLVGSAVGTNNTEFITNSFWDIYATGRSTSAGGAGDLGLATINMIDSGVFADSGWNFTDTWSIIPNQSYPFLKWQTFDIPFVTAYSIDSAVSHSGAGQITISADTQFLGGTVAISAFANPGYEFDSWTVTPDSGTFADTRDSVTIYTFADTNVRVTANFIELEFFGGDGSSGNPFQITTWRHLNNVRNYTTSHFKLINNLDSTTDGYDDYASATANNDSGWLPIGSGSGATAFQGTFDGDSKTISGLYINRPASNFVGLFGYTKNSMIKNIGIIDINCSGNNDVGGLAGSNIINLIIKNSYVTGNVNGNNNVGGLVGRNGYFNSIIENCYANVNVIGNVYIGGLVGTNENPIKNSYAIGNINGQNEVGGLVGRNLHSIKNSYAIGNVNGQNEVGGLVGRNSSATITNSYAIGNVVGSDTVGGLVGWNRGGTITNSYATGKTTGISNVGGLSGSSNNEQIINCFYDIYTTGQSDEGKGMGLATINMVDSGVFIDSGWNFTDTWTILPNQSYPFFKWQTSNTPFATAYSIDSAVNISVAGSVTISTDTQFAGGIVAITATANTGYEFDSWTIAPQIGIIEDQNNSVTIYTIADTDIVITANFISQFAGGDGSPGSPFQISSWRHLNNIRHFLGSDYSDSHFKLMSNLDSTTDGFDEFAGVSANAGAGWLPIGSAEGELAFQGTFDGDSHTISGLYINRPDSENVGFFGCIEDAEIKNITLIDIECTGNQPVGGLIGFINSGIVTNCFVTGNVIGNIAVGGLIGHNSGTITNSYSSSEVTGDSNIVGGLAGMNEGTITNSYATGNVNGGGMGVGGLIGSNPGTITNSYATGNVIGNGIITGGLVGANLGVLSNNYSTGNVDGNDNVGGLIGVNMGTITNSYATGNVNGNDNIGGLVGVGANGTITSSYAIGNVTGADNTGGLVGFVEAATIENSFYDLRTTGQSDEGKGLGLPTADLVKASTFTDSGWNLSDTWTIIEDVTYPFFPWQTSDTPYAVLLEGIAITLPVESGQSFDTDVNIIYLSGEIANVENLLSTDEIEIITKNTLTSDEWTNSIFAVGIDSDVWSGTALLTGIGDNIIVKLTSGDSVFSDSIYVNYYEPRPDNKIWYVSAAEGSDTIFGTGIGSETYPFKTLSQAMAFINEGDTVFVAAGIYSETLVIPHNNISLIGLESDTISENAVILDINDSSSASNNTAIYAENKTGINLENIQIRNYYTGINFDSVIFSSIENVYVHNNGRNGIYLNNNSDTNILSNNTSENNGFDGFSFEDSNNNTLTGNLSKDNAFSGFKFDTSTGNTVANNVSKDNGAYGFEFNNSTDNTVINNTSNNNVLDGFSLENSSDNILTDNVSDSNSGNGFGIVSGSNNNTISNNTSQNNLRGLLVAESDNNIISGNTVKGSVFAGVFIEDTTNNNWTQNSVSESGEYQFYLTGANISDTISNNNIILDSDTGIYNDVNQDIIFKGNWFGTTDLSDISASISGLNADSIIFQPYRLGRVDTAPNADILSPAAPDTVAAIVLSGSSIKVEWSPVTFDEHGEPLADGKLGGYRIYRADTIPSDLWTEVGEVSADQTYFINRGLDTATTYYYRVSAFDTNHIVNESFYSVSYSFDTTLPFLISVYLVNPTVLDFYFTNELEINLNGIIEFGETVIIHIGDTGYYANVSDLVNDTADWSLTLNRLSGLKVNDTTIIGVIGIDDDGNISDTYYFNIFVDTEGPVILGDVLISGDTVFDSLRPEINYSGAFADSTGIAYYKIYFDTDPLFSNPGYDTSSYDTWIPDVDLSFHNWYVKIVAVDNFGHESDYLIDTITINRPVEIKIAAANDTIFYLTGSLQDDNDTVYEIKQLVREPITIYATNEIRSGTWTIRADFTNRPDTGYSVRVNRIPLDDVAQHDNTYIGNYDAGRGMYLEVKVFDDTGNIHQPEDDIDFELSVNYLELGMRQSRVKLFKLVGNAWQNIENLIDDIDDTGVVVDTTTIGVRLKRLSKFMVGESPADIKILTPEENEIVGTEQVTVSGTALEVEAGDLVEIYINGSFVDTVNISVSNENYVWEYVFNISDYAGITEIDLTAKLISGAQTKEVAVSFIINPVPYEDDLRNAVIVPNPFRPNDGDNKTGRYFTGSNNDIFNPTGIHIYGLTDNTKIEIYDILGRRIRTIYNIDNYGMAIWDGRDSSGNNVSSGTYLIVISNDFQRVVRKVAIIR